MKKTFLAMLLAGGTMTMFAQTTQPSTTSPSTSPSTGTPSSTQPATGTTGTSGMQSGTTSGSTNNNTMSGTTGTTSGTMNNGSTTGTWNGVSNNTTPYNSTSWSPESDPSFGWNNYGVWNGSANWNSNPNASSVNGTTNMNNGTMNNGSMNNNMNTDASMNSSGSYSAYSGTAVAGLPANVQMRFNQDFPTGANNQYSWHQYGDWFHTHYMNNGRLMQYFYDQRGAGYALALPVLQTYVPENIVASALNKFGSSLYSIAMVKTADGNNAYQVGLLQRGQLVMHHLDENGASVANVWRVDSLDNMGTMNSTGTNAAMDANMTNGSTNNQMSGQSETQTTDGTNNGDKTKVKDGKIEIEHADGTETKIKWEDDKMKIKDKNGKTKIKKS